MAPERQASHHGRAESKSSYSRRVQAAIARRRGLLALTGREVDRVLKLWTQTVAAPVVSSFLFIVVFGLSLGGRIREIGGGGEQVCIPVGPLTRVLCSAADAQKPAGGCPGE